MISQTAEYALRATLHLAENDAQAPLRVGELAAAVGAPRNYLSKILGTLAREGVLASLRGPSGGFRLAERPERLRLSRIVELFDPAPGRRCLLGRARCSDAQPCGAHLLWRDISTQVDEFFRSTTLADMLASTGAVEELKGRSRGRGGVLRGDGASRGSELPAGSKGGT